LPMAWGTLYELTKLSDPAFEQAVATGAINPETTRAQASRMVRVQLSERPAYAVLPRAVVTYTPAVVAVPRYVTADDNAKNDQEPLKIVALSKAEPSEDRVASLALPQMERLVREVELAVQRGDFNVDATFAGRLRSVANRLLKIADDEGRQTIQ